MSTTLLNRPQCLAIVRQWLLSHDWQLTSPEQLTDHIWQAPCPQPAIENEIWQQYGIVLHNCCCDPAGANYQRAWYELAQWVQKQLFRLPGTTQDHQEIAQESLIKLEKQLTKEPLRQPRTLWAFTLQTARNQAIDLNRQRKATKRGVEEEMPPDEPEQQESWLEQKTLDNSPHQTEQTVADVISRQQLAHFFERLLSTPLQYQVAVMYFLDNLEPVEIALLLDKKAHEIRLVKARIVERLRNLPPQTKQALLAIIADNDHASN